MGIINTPRGEDEGGMLTPPLHRHTETELLEGAGRKMKPQSRATAITVNQAQISRTGPDGLPALPVGLKREEARTFTHIDPEGRGRSIGRQVDDWLAQMEQASLEEWKQDAVTE